MPAGVDLAPLLLNKISPPLLVRNINGPIKTLVDYVHGVLDTGGSLNLVAFSAGTITVNHALHCLDSDYSALSDSEKEAGLSKLHILLVASAVFDDDPKLDVVDSTVALFAHGWPAGIGSLHNLYCTKDNVVRIFGLSPAYARSTSPAQLFPTHPAMIAQIYIYLDQDAEHADQIV